MTWIYKYIIFRITTHWLWLVKDEASCPIKDNRIANSHTEADYVNQHAQSLHFAFSLRLYATLSYAYRMKRHTGIATHLQHQVDKLNFETSGSRYCNVRVVIYRDSISKQVFELPGQSWSGNVRFGGGVLLPSFECQNMSLPSSCHPSCESHCGLFEKHRVGL